MYNGLSCVFAPPQAGLSFIGCMPVVKGPGGMLVGCTFDSGASRLAVMVKDGRVVVLVRLGADVGCDAHTTALHQIWM